jgi:hypothetical protein
MAQIVDLDCIRLKRVPISWTYRGPISFQSRHRSISGSPTSFIRLRKGDARSILWDPNARDEVVQNGLNGTVSFPNGQAKHSYAVLGGVERGHRYFKIIVQELRTESAADVPHITRETILGLILGSDDPESVSARFETTVFGRKMLVCGYSTKGSSGQIDATQVIYYGPPFPIDKRMALLDLLRFLGGSRGNSTFREIFNRRGRRIRLAFRKRGVASRVEAIKPIDLRFVSNRPALAQLGKDFGKMVDGMLQLRKKNAIRLSAVMHHYSDATISSYPTSRLRNFSVAVEALAGLILNRQTKPSYIMDKTVFNRMIESVDAAFLAAFDVAKISLHVSRAWTPSDALNELHGRIKSINRQGPRIEVLDTLDGLGVRVKPIERKTFNDCRNRVLHDGYRGDENLVRALRRNDQAADLIANLFNRSMLKLLGYSGGYLDAYSRRKTLSLNRIPVYRMLKKP